MELHSLKKSVGNTKPKTRVGRGGTRGKTAGRGTKGQKARAGNKRRPQWRDEIKKLPKRRGYGKNRARGVVPRVPVQGINLKTLTSNFKDGAVVSLTTLMKARGLLRRVSGKMPPVKILGIGEVPSKLTIEGLNVSTSAKAAIEKNGGKVVAKK